MLTGDYVGGGQKVGFRDTFTQERETVIDHLAELHGADGK
jgi:hypothetical protein